jgi:5'-deoxynucleotidase YfbR-like HD superfamily hydrolase
LDPAKLEAKSKSIASYVEKYAVLINLTNAAERLPDDWKQYNRIKTQILELMEDADKIADRLRRVVAERD